MIIVKWWLFSSTLSHSFSSVRLLASTLMLVFSYSRFIFHYGCLQSTESIDDYCCCFCSYFAFCFDIKKTAANPLAIVNWKCFTFASFYILFSVLLFLFLTANLSVDCCFFFKSIYWKRKWNSSGIEFFGGRMTMAGVCTILNGSIGIGLSSVALLLHKLAQINITLNICIDSVASGNDRTIHFLQSMFFNSIKRFWAQYCTEWIQGDSFRLADIFRKIFGNSDFS